MSSSSQSDRNSYDVDDLLEIRTRRRELRKEKDRVKESQSQGFELIKRLDLHLKTLSDSHSEGKIQIQELEREMRICYQEIDYLQDQLNTRDTEVIYLREQLHSIAPKLTDMEMELQNSYALIEKLEELLSSATLESQCEIESMKLDIMALEQSCLEAKKVKEDTVQEEDMTNRLIYKLEEAQKTVEYLEDENKELREMLEEYEINTGVLCQKIGKHFKEWGEDKDTSPITFQSFLRELLSLEMSMYGKLLGPLLSKFAVVTDPEENLTVNTESMSRQIHEYELLVKKLKEDLKAQKIRFNDEAEDLAQEMAELRYQFTDMLEEERKRRACIEQASLQRIAELEGQIQNEGRQSVIAIRKRDET